MTISGIYLISNNMKSFVTIHSPTPGVKKVNCLVMHVWLYVTHTVYRINYVYDMDLSVFGNLFSNMCNIFDSLNISELQLFQWPDLHHTLIHKMSNLFYNPCEYSGHFHITVGGGPTTCRSPKCLKVNIT